MTSSKVAIGCPVRNRAWVLPEYLAALEKIEYENKHYLFLENDSVDNTLDLLCEFVDRVSEDIWDATVKSIATTETMWDRGDYAHNQYANLANVRNQFLEMFLRTDADYLLSVDSDVIVPPDIVTRLLEIAERFKRFTRPGTRRRHIIGAAISNIPGKPLDGRTQGNWMFEYPFSKSPRTVYTHPEQYELTGVFDVDLIGAVYLIPRSVIEAGARYAPHGQGEDIPFCQAAQRLGYRLLVNMDVKCEHRMVKQE